MIDGNKSMNRQDGFSLSELMITVVIMGILGAVGYPSYLDHVKRSNRNDARGAVSRAASDLERFFATNGTYTTDVTATSLTIDDAEAFSDDANYKITISAGATGNIATSYRVTATAYGSQTSDSDCTTMSLDSAGTRVPTPATSRCW